MKFLTVLFLTFLTFFSGPKQQTHRVNSDRTMAASNNGVASGESQCHAKQINPNDPQAYLPDPDCTPGAKNSDVTQSNLYSTICMSGYTKTIRPPASYTDQLKLQQMQQYGYSDENPRDYEEDHFIPLELGGNPTDPKNLWPEPHPSLNEKDTVEDYLNKQVCDGNMTLAQAQSEITQNWYTVYQQIQ
jgi:hypothetical protein